MKKFCLSLMVFFSFSMLFAFPNMTIKRYNTYTNDFEVFIEITNNSFKRFAGYDHKNGIELYEQISIKDNEFYNSENKKVGKWEKKGNLYLFSFFYDEYLSDYYEIDSRKNYLLKREIFEDGILDSRYEYDKSTGKQISYSYSSNDGENTTTYEYWRTTGNKQRSTSIYSDGEKYISEYAENGYTKLKETVYNSDSLVKHETLYTYFSGTNTIETATIKYFDGTIYKHEYSKDNGEEIKYTKLNASGIIISEETYEYDEKNNKVRTTYYGKNRQFESTEDYIYNKENKRTAVIYRNKENSITGKEEFIYDSETGINVKFIYYKKNSVERIREFDRITGKCLKEYDYSDETYYRIIREFDPSLESWLEQTYTTKEIYETEENVIAFYYTFERNPDERKVIRKNKYSSNDELLVWYTYEYFDDSYTERKINTYKNGKAIDIREYNEDGFLISHSVLNEETVRIEKYTPIVFDKNGYYNLSSRFSLSTKIATFSSVDYSYIYHRNEYSNWNNTYKAVIRKFDFSFNEDAYDLLKQLKTDRKIIVNNGITLVDTFKNSTFYCFKIDDDGFIDFDNCYMIELIKK